MDSGIKIKNIVIFGIFLIFLMWIFDDLMKTYEIGIHFKVKKCFDKIHQSQKIAPARLYINAWRIAKLEYADSTMNYQDWNRWRNRYHGKIKTMEDANVAISSMLASLNDIYTRFLQTNKYKRQKVILESKITGLGLNFNKTDDGIIVNKILKNSPAETEELMPGDKIIKINDKYVILMSDDEIQNYIEAKEGEEVTLIIKRGWKILQKKLNSKETPIDTMSYRITKDNIGIITISTIMGEKAVDDFNTIIDKTNKTKGLIIDLRNNYGGIIANAVEMADSMFRNGNIVNIKSKGKIKYKIYSDKDAGFTEKPIVILVNNRTASAAEILAGALKYNLNAVLIGENTYGKNAIQHVIPLANNTGLIITSEKYILPNGEDIQDKGITPDYVYTNLKRTKKNDELMKKAEKLLLDKVKNNKESDII